MLDVVKRYDVDGIHIDDYFYPYRESRVVTRRVRKKRVRTRVEIPFPDDKTWKKYGRPAGFTDRDAWRRSNIDDFVRSLYKGAKAIKPATLVGISPFGIWRPGSPPGVTGLDSYAEIYADSKRWLAEGWLDYVVPQLYWQVGGTQDRFRLLDAWWRSENPQGRYIFPGLYTSHVYGGTRSVVDRRDRHAGHDASRSARRDDRGRGARSFPPGRAVRRQRSSVQHAEWSLCGTGDRAGVSVAGSGRCPGRRRSPSCRATARPRRSRSLPGDSIPVRWWLIQTRGRDGVWTTTLRPTGEGKLGVFAFGTNDPDEIAVTAIGVTGIASVPSLVASGVGMAGARTRIVIPSVARDLDHGDVTTSPRLFPQRPDPSLRSG